MSATPEPPRLRTVPATERDALDGDGLALVYAALERIRTGLGLERLTVAVEDTRRGRQLLTVPRGALPGPGEREVAWATAPHAADDTGAIAVARALCRVVLGVAGPDDPADPFDRVELALRTLDGVEGAAVEADEDVLRVQTAPAASREDVARGALATVKAGLDRTVVVELVPGGPDPATVAPPIWWAPASALEVLALRTDEDHDELEVHLGDGDVRMVGRATLAGGLLGAVEATLEAWHDRPGAARRSVGWARTVETSPTGRAVVAVALSDTHRVTVAHGIGEGLGPLDAAARATVDALRR